MKFGFFVPKPKVLLLTFQIFHSDQDGYEPEAKGRGDESFATG